MIVSRLCAVALTVLGVSAQVTTITLPSTTVVVSGVDNLVPTNVTYLSYSSTITLATSTGSGFTNSLNFTNSTTTRRSSRATTTQIAGVTTSTGTRTSTASRPTNTQPCNGHAEFCNRKYSNITMVAAHNFPFVRKNNVASNQVYEVIDQLDDGVRMLQAQAHYVNNTMYFCHTSCDLLNVGTVVDQFTKVREWLDDHPFEVVTILIGNSDFASVGVQQFVPAIENSGLERYAYRPPQIPMSREAWPTLAQLILTGQRVIIFMDYNANQTAVPYILDEFSQMWETPFSPVDPSFPCTQQRPPGINRQQATDRLYMANHNLNTPVNFLGSNILVPNFALINQTNAVSGNSSLGVAADSCTADWGRPPNFLLVDFYNFGSSPGSVFQVAAKHNNVTYNGPCCGNGARSPATRLVGFNAVPMMVMLFLITLVVGLCL